MLQEISATRKSKEEFGLSIKEEIRGIYQSINRKEKRQRADQVVV